MSKLLIHDYPLMVSPRLAKAIGLNEAIVLQQVHYWLGASKTFRDGKPWVYNTFDAWQQENFYFWSISTVKRTVASLEDRGLLVSRKFGKGKGDHTKWYTIDYGVVDALELPEVPERINLNQSERINLNQSSSNRDYTENTIHPCISFLESKIGVLPRTYAGQQMVTLQEYWEEDEELFRRAFEWAKERNTRRTMAPGFIIWAYDNQPWDNEQDTAAGFDPMYGVEVVG